MHSEMTRTTNVRKVYHCVTFYYEDDMERHCTHRRLRDALDCRAGVEVQVVRTERKYYEKDMA